MIENLLKDKKVLIIGHYNARYIDFLQQLRKNSNIYFLSTNLNLAFREKILRLWRLYRQENVLSKFDEKLMIKIREKIQRIKPDVIIVPSSDYLIKILSEIKHSSNTIEKVNAKLLNKKFQERFMNILSIPSINKIEKIKFPVVIKPAYGSGSRNVFLVKNKKELNEKIEYFRNKKTEFVIQKFIPKDYFAIYNLFILNGKVIGFVYYNNESKEDIIKKFLLRNIIRFVNKTKIQGFVSFQCRIINNKIYTLEINPRIHHLTPNAYDFFTMKNKNDYLINKRDVKVKKVKIKEKVLMYYIEKMFLLNHVKSLLYDMNILSFILNIPILLWKIIYTRFILPIKHF